MKLIFPESVGFSEPTIPIQWCLTRSETEELKAKKAENICVLIVTSYEDRQSEDRYLVRAEEALTYITFNRPGKHTVFAKVVFQDHLHKSGMNSLVFSTISYNRFNFKVLNKDRTDFVPDSHFYDNGVAVLQSNDEGEVIVPKEHFPPEPPEWLQRIANFGFRHPPSDECAFRRRLLWLLIKLPALAFWFFVTTIVRAFAAGYLSLFGVYQIKYSAIFHPWNMDMNDVWYRTDFRNTWFEFDREYRSRSKFIYLLHPVLYIGVFSLLTWLKLFLKSSYVGVLQMLWGLVGMAFFSTFEFLVRIFSKFGVILIGFVIGLLILKVVRYGLKNHAKKMNARNNSPEFKKVQEELQQKGYDDLYKLLSCGRAPKTPSLNALPKEKRTLYLKYRSLKAKVCRPYASR